MISKSLKITIICAFYLILSCSQILAQDKKIVLATDPWEPHYGPDLKNGGYFTEIVKEAFKISGYDCNVKFVPWKRALEFSKMGHYDGLLGAFYNKERTQYFRYSEPISESHLVFFSKKGRNIQYKNLKDLSQYKIGVIRGYKYSEEFDSADFLNKEEVATAEQNIKKIIGGRIDIFLDSKEVIFWLLRTKHPDYIDLLEAIKPAYKKNKLYVPISKKVNNNEQIVDDFNKGLRTIKENGTFAKIIKNHRFEFTNN